MKAKNKMKMLRMLRELILEDREMESKTLKRMDLEEEFDEDINVLNMDILEVLFNDCTEVEREHEPNIMNSEGNFKILWLSITPSTKL